MTISQGEAPNAGAPSAVWSALDLTFGPFRYKALRQELEAIASCELGDVLDSWGSLSEGQAARLARYLRSEMGAYGLLGLEHGRENGVSLGQVRREARAILRTLEG